jgi:hypothetical protein
MMRTVVDQVAALTKAAQIAQPIVGRIMIKMRGGKHDMCCPHLCDLFQVRPTSDPPASVAPRPSAGRRSGMTDVDAARLPLMLATLHLPTIGRQWKSFGARADTEGWGAARYLAALCEHVRSAGRQDLRHLRLCRRADSAQGASAGARRSRQLDRTERQYPVFRPVGHRQESRRGSHRRRADRAGRRVLFTRTTDIVQRLQAARRDLSLPALLAKLDRLDCLAR